MDMPNLINSGFFGGSYPSVPPMMQPNYMYQPQVTPFQPQMYNSPLMPSYDSSLPIGYIPNGEAVFYRPQYRDMPPARILSPLQDGLQLFYNAQENVNYVIDVPMEFQQMMAPQPMMQQPVQGTNIINVGSEGYVFQPTVPNYINPYQRRDDYYNPYPHLNPPQTMGYGGYRPFGYGYTPLMSMDRQQKMAQAQVDMGKTKIKMMLGMIGKSELYDDEAVDKALNPFNTANIKSNDQMQAESDWRNAERVYTSLTQGTFGMSPEQYNAQIMQQYQINFHQAFDSHSLCQFFEEDLPKLMREFWIEENIDRGRGRNRSMDYKQDEYSELLGLHNYLSPFSKMLLDDSRYDNNAIAKQAELGLELAQKAKEYASKRLSEIRLVPPSQYLQTPEAQEHRRQFTQTLLDQMYQRAQQRKPDRMVTVEPVTEAPPSTPPMPPPENPSPGHQRMMEQLAAVGIRPFEWKNRGG